MNLLFYTTLLLSVQVAFLSDLRILEGAPLNCTQEGLGCTAKAYNCLDEKWLQPNNLTPSAPDDNLQVEVLYKHEWNTLVPVLVVKWRARTDGSIIFLTGTEVHVLKIGTNQMFCVRYSFLNKIHFANNAKGEKWSFLLDRVVVNPGHSYYVTVYNLPKPNINHDQYKVSQSIHVKGCNEDPMMQKTVMCLETGSQWYSNISLWRPHDRKDVITINYNRSKYSSKERVVVQCSGEKQSEMVTQTNERRVNVTFLLSRWSPTCCKFVVEVQPFFNRCRNDCVRHQENFSICDGESDANANLRYDACETHPEKPDSPWTNVVHALPLVFVVAGVVSCLCWWAWKPRKGLQPGKPPTEEILVQTRDLDMETTPSTEPKKVLIIYSLDHTLYKDIVLKLSAFLRAKCGVDVVLDLLDTAWLGTVGRMQWLDWQKQHIEKSSNKILILCSRGVQAKWRAMCGEPQVMLREDVRSPMGDMLTPAFSLIVPDLLYPVAFGKYMVAYFDDICSEDDVPPPFNITIKYKLMKHFEELYFRILDKEKHEPGRVNRIEGIAEDEYFNCPSGKALRDAIEAFQAYQLENPDWFDRECVDNEDEALESDVQCPLLEEMCSVSVMQNVPEYRDTPPVFINTVEEIKDAKDIVCLSPIINDEQELVFAHQVHLDTPTHLEQNQVYARHPSAHLAESHIHPILAVNHLDANQAYPVYPAGQLKDNQVYTRQHLMHLTSQVCSVHQALQLEDGLVYPVFDIPAEVCSVAVNPRQQEMLARPRLLVEEHDEELVSLNGHSADELESQVPLQQSLAPVASPPVSSVEEELSYEPEESSDWAQADCLWKRPLSGSDQGYISRTSPQHGFSLREDFPDHLDTLSRLQETCLSLTFKPPGPSPGTYGNLANNECAEQL